MRKKVILVSLLMCLMGTQHPALADNRPPAAGEQLPEIILPVPQDARQRAYLGLAATGNFSIDRIDARVVIIEIFSMYCPHCQRHAPAVNRLYEEIADRATARGRVKLIGIGVGNSAFEVAFFKKTYKVPFPLFADGDFAIHKKLGEVRTPYFVVVRLDGDGAHQITYAALGGFEDPARFLDRVMESAALR